MTMIKKISITTILFCSFYFSNSQNSRVNRLPGKRTFSVNWDSTIIITKTQLDSITLRCTTLLSEKDLNLLTERDHTDILRLANSGLMVPLRDTSIFQTQEYSKFLKLLDMTQYIKTLKKLYPDWVYSRGMGYYFPKLQLEYYGTPHLRSFFLVEN